MSVLGKTTLSGKLFNNSFFFKECWINTVEILLIYHWYIVDILQIFFWYIAVRKKANVCFQQEMASSVQSEFNHTDLWFSISYICNIPNIFTHKKMLVFSRHYLFKLYIFENLSFSAQNSPAFKTSCRVAFMHIMYYALLSNAMLNKHGNSDW